MCVFADVRLRPALLLQPAAATVDDFSFFSPRRAFEEISKHSQSVLHVLSCVQRSFHLWPRLQKCSRVCENVAITLLAVWGRLCLLIVKLTVSNTKKGKTEVSNYTSSVRYHHYSERLCYTIVNIHNRSEHFYFREGSNLG